MEDKFTRTKETIAEKLDLPRDVVLNIPKITITGDSEISIENHKGVMRFEDKEIKIKTSVGLVTIYGQNFEILFMGGSTLTISGRFTSVVYENE